MVSAETTHEWLGRPRYRSAALVAAGGLSCLLASGCELVADIQDVSRADAGPSCNPGECPPTVIADMQLEPNGLAIRDGTLVWGAAMLARVFAVSIETGASKEWETFGSPFDVAVDGGDVYWTHQFDRCLARAPLSGGTPSEVGTCVGTGNGKIAVDTAHIYWVINDDADSLCDDPIRCCPTTTVGCVKVAERATNTVMTFEDSAEGDPSGVTVDETHVYWGAAMSSTEGVIKRCTKEGPCQGASEVLATGSSQPLDLVADGGHVYWVSSFGPVYRTPINAAGGEGEVIAPGNFSAKNIATDEAYVYWTDDPSSGADHVYRARKDGSEGAVPIADAVSPRGIAVDGTHVYWAEHGNGGRVMRVAK